MLNRQQQSVGSFSATALSAEEAASTTLLEEVPEAVAEQNKLSPAEQKKVDAEVEKASAAFEAAAKVTTKADPG